MKSIFKFIVFCMMAIGRFVDDKLFHFQVRVGFVKSLVLLGRPYAGYNANTIVQLPTNVEAALIAQGFATNSAGPVTPGNVSTQSFMGRAGIAAAGTQVVVSNPAFNAESKFSAYLSNAAADGTALYITRIVPAAGQVTFILNAAATAAVSVDWVLLGPQGGLTNNLP